MRRRPGSQPQKTLVHPNDPSITVTVRKPKRSETKHLNSIIATNRRVSLVYDKNGEVALDEYGNERMHIEQLWPLEALVESLRVTVVGWAGINDESGNPIALGQNKENVGELAEDWLDVEIEEPVKNPKEGTPATRTSRLSFANWISRETAKPETFDADPSTPPSATP